MTPVSFQSKASVVCLVTTAVFIDFCLKKLNVFPNILVKKQTNIRIPKNKSQGIKILCSFCVNYFLRYYIMMQHQPIVKIFNWGEWVSTQVLSAPISSLSLLLLQTQAARWKASVPEQLTGAHMYLKIGKSDYPFHGYSSGTCRVFCSDLNVSCHCLRQPWSTLDEQSIFQQYIFRLRHLCFQWPRMLEMGRWAWNIFGLFGPCALWGW